jgi:hypothetical protein
MVLNHASEESAAADTQGTGGSKTSIVDNLKSMLSKPKDKAA